MFSRSRTRSRDDLPFIPALSKERHCYIVLIMFILDNCENAATIEGVVMTIGARKVRHTKQVGLTGMWKAP